MSHRHNELDMSCALSSHLFLSHLDTATVAHDALVSDTLVLTAGALVVLLWTEDALAEQTVALRLVGTIVDGLGFCHLAERALEDFLR